MFSTPQTPGPDSFFDNSLMSVDSKPSLQELEAARTSHTAATQIKLNRRLGPEYLSQRPSPGGGPQLTYVEGWKIIGLANEVFGYNGWSSTITKMETDFIDQCPDTRRYSVGVTAMVKITLKDGSFHEDVGYGTGDNQKSKGVALDKAKKEAVTDGIKRALRNFGNVLGLCLYEKSFTQEVLKMGKVAPPKLDKSELHRRPEFDNGEASTSITTPGAGPSSHAQAAQAVKPLTSVPAHMRSAANTSSNNGNSKGTTPQTSQQQGNGGQQSSVRLGMTTPMKTPMSLQSRTYPTRPAQPENPPAQQSASNSDSLQKRYAPPPAQLPTESAPVVAPNPPTPKVEVEVDPIDSYFTSDDDAFLAAFDLDAIDKDANEKVNAEIAKASAGSSAVAHQSGSSHAGGGFNGATASGRSATAANNQAPSAGGVRFPAGMPVNSSSNSRQNLTSFVGTKRPAEAMQEAAKRPSYSGMGYAQQQQPQQQANNGRREPLSSLQVGEGGDVKRVKR